MPVWGSVYFQNGVSSVMEQLVFFHDHTMFVLIMVMVMVGYLLGCTVWNSLYNRGIREGQELESVWTVIPVVLLLMVAFPSLWLLYLMEESDNAEVTIKVMGHQWYWAYEYSDLGAKGFEAYMQGSEEAPDFRLLSCDNFLVVPFSTMVRMVVTSLDVIHSWTVPALGVKTDAVPGRLNQINMMFKRPGVFVGQCSEICGANHSFMPISMNVVSRADFLSVWV